MCEFEKEIARMIGIQLNLKWVRSQSRVTIHVLDANALRAGPPHGQGVEISSYVKESRSILLPNPFQAIRTQHQYVRASEASARGSMSLVSAFNRSPIGSSDFESG